MPHARLVSEFALRGALEVLAALDVKDRRAVGPTYEALARLLEEFERARAAEERRLDPLGRGRPAGSEG